MEEVIYAPNKEKDPILLTAKQIKEMETTNKINELKTELSKLSEDIIQSQVGEIVPNIEERKTRFIALHNELRVLEGKEPRKTYGI